MSSMSAVRPDTPRRSWRGLPARSPRSNKIRPWRGMRAENLEAMHQDNVTVVTGPAGGWLGRAGAVRRHPAGRSHRGGGEGALPSAQGGWAHGGGGRTDPERAGDPLSLRERRRHRSTDFRCLGSDAARISRRSRVSCSKAAISGIYACLLWREYTTNFLIREGAYRRGFHPLAAPLWLRFASTARG